MTKINNYLSLPARTQKPRESGLTCIHDVQLNRAELTYLLDDFSSYLDVAKLGIGTAYVTPHLKDKIGVYKKFDIDVYFGGTLFEKFYHQNKVNEYKQFLENMGISTVEISCGTIDLSLEERVYLVEDFKSNFTVLSEVGSKDAEKIMPPSVWIHEMKTLLNAGCKYVIAEGRDSGTAGLYRPNGELRSGLAAEIFNEIPKDKVIFEAPTNQCQMFFINHVGANVNLGNVKPQDLLVLETQRQGLRSETFYN